MFSNQKLSESISKTATLPDDSPETFARFLTWIYRGKIEHTSEHTAPGPKGSTYQLIDLFLFAEKYLIIELMDSTIDLLIHIQKEHDLFCSEDDIRHGYEGSHAYSKLRVYLVRTFAWVVHHCDLYCITWSTETLGELLAEVDDLRDDWFLLVRSQKLVPLGNPVEAEMCDYHQHGECEPCPRKKSDVIELSELVV